MIHKFPPRLRVQPGKGANFVLQSHAASARLLGMDTHRRLASFWVWVGSAFAAGIIVGIVLGVVGVIVLASMLTVMISPA